MTKPEAITTAADCTALAEYEWEHELADDARAQWKGGREQYVADRAPRLALRFGVKAPQPELPAPAPRVKREGR